MPPPTKLWWPNLVLVSAMDLVVYIEDNGRAVEDNKGLYLSHLEELLPKCTHLWDDEAEAFHARVRADEDFEMIVSQFWMGGE